MRESGCPVAHSEHYEGFWALVDYASVFEAARDDDLFNSYPSVGVPASELPLPILPIESDPPETQELREVTLKRFSPGSAERFREAAIEMTDEAIDAFIERGECDLVGELTTPLPARLILRLLNFDESRFMDWVGWVHTTVHDRAHDPEKAAIAGMEMFGEIVKHMEQRRAEGLGDDLFSDILRGTLNGEPLDDGQITMYTVLMMLGGMDTTSGFTGNVLLRLCKDPELRVKFIDDPSLVKKSTDELLRLYTPTLGLARTVSRDADFHGQPLCQGDRAILMWAAANRDPAMFAEPRRTRSVPRERQEAHGVRRGHAPLPGFALRQDDVRRHGHPGTGAAARLRVGGRAETVRGRGRGVRRARTTGQFHPRPAQGLTGGVGRRWHRRC